MKLRIRVGRGVKASRLMKGAHHLPRAEGTKKERIEQSRNNETGGGASVQD